MKIFLRALCPALLLGWLAFAEPPLSTIDDVLYKADGTRFNGLVTIAWTSFQAPDQSQIATQMITLQVINGHLHVQLVPTTLSNPEVFYTVTYNSDGLVQFTETWSVPPSSQPLRLSDIRVPNATINGNGNGGDVTNAQGPVPESDVTGLVSDLSARPMKGPAYAPGAVALINPQGTIDAVAGNAGDCVHVDGSSGPCGGAQPGFMDGDLPSGIVDGSNITFTLTQVPSPAASLYLYRNGLLQDLNVDYTVTNNNVVQFSAGSIPQPGDTLLANYRVVGTGSNAVILTSRAMAPRAQSAPHFPTSQVLCSGSGIAIKGTRASTLATCSIPQGVLAASDRLEVKFDLGHQGTAGGFMFRLQWGGTAVFERTGGAGDALVSGHADAGLDQGGAQVSTQSWGTVLPLQATVANAKDPYAAGLVIDFQGALNAGGDSLVLRNYAVVRVP